MGLAAFPEDLALVPSTHVPLKTACNSSFRESDTLSWPPKGRSYAYGV